MNVMVTITTGTSFSNFRVEYTVNGTSYTTYSPSVPKATLAAGYFVTGLPSTAINIRIVAIDGSCVGYTKVIVINKLTTTTTTTTTAAPPSFIQISNTEAGTNPNKTRTQIFEVGPNVPVGAQYMLMVYSHGVTVIAVAGDTPASIASKMVSAINSTTAAQWNDHSSAPPTGTTGFKPTASLNTSIQVKVTLNWANSFAVSAYA